MGLKLTLCKPERKGILPAGVTIKITVMRKFIIPALALIANHATAQNNTASNLIEGGKTLVELVRVFKMPRTGMQQQPLVEKKDSCALKNITDICIRNSGVGPLLVSLYRRNGNVYDAGALSLKILPRNQECLYELKAGVYKIKYEMEEGAVKKTINEGEIKLNSCEKFYREIKND
jgi:hypothetical protein